MHRGGGVIGVVLHGEKNRPASGKVRPCMEDYRLIG
jgi:hypothetical protein